ncbi:U3 snoRNP protein [Aspergillus nanangensis]|uniref:U3 small nucleolar ribonucleoprotein protein MPP10 n=1 Tax=Aspergillus nanangensis TaxID=2582783 RepID=A0AAD4CBT8_ASPNN|nr:U3 snoRNP protein [Aspergillus nanangensis]
MGRKKSAQHPELQNGTSASLPLNSALSTPWDFLCPTADLHSTIIQSAKYFLDPLASSVSEAQTTRQRIGRKRKRSVIDENFSPEALQLRSLYAEGFTSDQIWEQASRILGSASEEIQYDHALYIQHENETDQDENEEQLLDDDLTMDSMDPSGLSEGSDDDEEEEEEDEEDGDKYGYNADSTNSVDDGPDCDLENSMDLASDDDAATESSTNDETKRGIYTEDRFGLNDGFFSIDDFNKQTESLERQDTNGGPDDDAESDDEEVNWHTDPLGAGTMPLALAKKPTHNAINRDDDDSDEDGPVFDSVDIHAPSDSDSDLEGNAFAGVAERTGWVDTSDIKYDDFFAPPPRKITSKKSRPLPKTQPHNVVSEDDINRAMADVHRDLFQDEVSVDEGDVSNDESNPLQTQRSTHEKQRARLADEIRRLEAASVAKKEWMLAGEAKGVERPMNSLIEEDLEFERIGKPVPVVTTEVSEDIEELVKRRILAKEFDEVIRRRPGVTEGQRTRRGLLELDDTKAQQSLAELYQTDHLRATDPNYVDPNNQKLVREHNEISTLWKEISSQLDTLSNWHYKPQAAQASINVVTDVATITMEDAQPAASGSVGANATLAPQEIYTLGDDGSNRAELILKNGTTVAKEEITRNDKARLRRQHKKQKKLGAAQSTQPRKAVEKQQIVSDLKKGGVKVIGKEGQVTDIHGKKIEANGHTGADVLKL